MNSIQCCVIICLLFNTSVYSTIKSGHVLQKSHPMLASVFSVADSIRKLQAQSAEQKMLHNSGLQNKDNFAHLGNKENQKDFIKPTNVGNPYMDKTISLQNKHMGDKNLPKTGLGMTGVPIVPLTVTTNSKYGHGKIGSLEGQVLSDIQLNKDPARESTGVGLAADMLCSLCQHQGNQNCIAIHCANDGASRISPGEELPPLVASQPDADSIPVLSDKLDIKSQIDRHDLLHLTNINSPPEHNSLDMIRLQQLPSDPIGSRRETTAPIWLLSDNLQRRVHHLPRNTSPEIQGSTDFVPLPLAAKVRPADIVRNPINSRPEFSIHPTELNVNSHSESPGVVFAGENRGSIFPSVKQPTGTESNMVGGNPEANVPRAENINIQPLDIPTETFIQLLRNAELSFPNNFDPLVPQSSSGQQTNFFESSGTGVSNFENIATTENTPDVNEITTNRKRENSMGFPTGFVEGNTIGHHPDSVNTFTSIPHIPTAGNIFADTRNDMKPINKLILVIKEHGKTEKVAVHIGDGPLPNEGISLLETRGQHSTSEQTNVPTFDSLVSSDHGHSQQNLNHQHMADHSHQNMNHHHSTDQNKINHH